MRRLGLGRRNLWVWRVEDERKLHKERTGTAKGRGGTGREKGKKGLGREEGERKRNLQDRAAELGEQAGLGEYGPEERIIGGPVVLDPRSCPSNLQRTKSTTKKIARWPKDKSASSSAGPGSKPQSQQTESYTHARSPRSLDPHVPLPTQAQTHNLPLLICMSSSAHRAKDTISKKRMRTTTRNPSGVPPKIKRSSDAERVVGHHPA